MFRLPNPAPTRVAIPQRPQPLAPWDCAEWCWQKWSHPGYFKEYQQCVDACREKWWSARPAPSGAATPGELSRGCTLAGAAGQVVAAGTQKCAQAIGFPPFQQCVKWGPCQNLEFISPGGDIIPSIPQPPRFPVSRQAPSGVPGEAGDADLTLGQQHGAAGVWRPDLSYLGARGPYGQGWREARQGTFSQQYDAFLRQANPIKGMPGGSVTGCIAQNQDKDDPGAYCAAIADRIEPGWRHRNGGAS